MLDRPISLTTAEFNNCSESNTPNTYEGEFSGAGLLSPIMKATVFIVICYVLFLPYGVVMDLEM